MADPSSHDDPDLHQEKINSFALVSYLSGALGEWMDQTRRDLEPNSLAPRAHITILPPRPIAPGFVAENAVQSLRRQLPCHSAIEIRLGQVEVFPLSNVVYIAVDGGFELLRQMHAALNQGALAFPEPFPYHPHVTLVQGLAPEAAGRVRDEASRRWSAYSGPRRFVADPLVFVQNTLGNRWLDLERFALPVAVPHSSRRD